MEKIQILYHSKEKEKVEKISKGDWIDLRAAEEVHLKKGEYTLISLGVSMKLPEGYEVHIAPRSSTFKNFGLIQTNGIGIVDGSYCSEKDIYKMPVLAVRDTVVHINDRICQFRIVKNQPEICFEEVEHLDGPERGGFGSTVK